MSLQEFVVFGERCSGTNHAVALIEKNLPLRHRHCGWKHTRIEPRRIPNPERILVIVIVRSLPDWLRSLHLTPHHLGPPMRAVPFSKFIRREVSTVLDFACAISPHDYHFGLPLSCEHLKGKPFANLMRMRVHKYRGWLQATKQLPHAVLLKHEDFLTNPRNILEKVAQLAGLPTPLSETQGISEYKGLRDLAGYTPKNYALLSHEDAAQIAGQTDSALETELGYDVAAELEKAVSPVMPTDIEAMWSEVASQISEPLRIKLKAALEAQTRHLCHLESLCEDQHHYQKQLFAAFEADRPTSHIRLQPPKGASNQWKLLQAAGIVD